MKQLITAILLFMASAVQAELTLELNESSVSVGQSFRLVLVEENGNTTANPDLGPLKKDFTIVGTERSTNYSIINNETHTSRQWTIVLIPKRVGTLPIPPLTVGQEQTQASSIEVREAGSGASVSGVVNDQQDVMLQAEVSTRQPYVNEQVIYTVKLYNSRRLLDAAFQPPSVEDGLLIPLGDARRYQESIQGRYYSVEEQKYAVFPQKSGSFAIRPPSFTALIYEDMPQQVSIKAPAITLDVRPASPDFKGKDWLPAKHLVLTETWDQPSRTLEQGSTLIRRIGIEATGLPAQLLPALSIPIQDGQRVYQDKAVEQNNLRQGNVVGNTTLNVTYLFNKAGETTIPAIQVSWFNTETGKEEVTILPERQLIITAAANSSPAPASPAVSQPVVEDSSKASSEPTPVMPVQNSMVWWLVGGLVLAWGVTLQLWWKQRNKAEKPIPRTHGTRELKQACAANQAVQAQKALLTWAREQWPHASILNLHDICRLSSDQTLNRQIDILSEALYQAGETVWNGSALWQAVSSFRPDKSAARKASDDLPPANPA
ncbi:BatD family protein [Legionella sp. CNM-4043-24]|uniref:BatD family protein n=1 Tax=Legionella sp. CNM-4043-24 TaxID=3421646 RepID=UPI00403A99C7